MIDDKKTEGDCPPELKAKMEVVKMIRKLAMELLAKGSEEEVEMGEGDAVIAKVDVEAVPGEEVAEELAEGNEEVEEDEGDDNLNFLDKMIKKKKQMA